MPTVIEAEAELKNIEASLKRLLTQVENSCIATSTKSALVANLEEIATEVHHLVPFGRCFDDPERHFPENV